MKTRRVCTNLVLQEGGVDDERIAAFMQAHLQDMHASSPPGSVHALDLSQLRRPGLRFWSAWTGSPRTLAGTGALQQLNATHGEIKSMRTAAPLRGQGVASFMLEHLLTQARLSGWTRLSLETGTQAFFEPARALYARHGFTPCRPFGSYRDDPASCFMTLHL
jgi:putative acetyltransferase